MELRVDNLIITESIDVILKQLRRELNGTLLKDIVPKGHDVVCTCPQHKMGQENKPSCYILNVADDPRQMRGMVHCFTCGYHSTFWGFIGDCFGESSEFGKEWLKQRYGDIFVEVKEQLTPIELHKQEQKKYLPEDVLKQYEYYHPYIFKRGVSKDIVDKFEIGFDKEENAVTFPVRDINGKLLTITRRCVDKKRFHLEEAVGKPVYLLNYVLKENIRSVIVVESQINALVAWTYGYPAIALFGTGSSEQYDILKKSGIRRYVLCFDGDNAGRKGATRFISNMPKDLMISDVIMPAGKDVADCSKDEFENILKYNKII